MYALLVQVHIISALVNVIRALVCIISAIAWLLVLKHVISAPMHIIIEHVINALTCILLV